MKRDNRKTMGRATLAGILVAALLLSGCGTKDTADPVASTAESSVAETAETERAETNSAKGVEFQNVLEPHVIDDKYRTTYEVFVYSFYDSDGDGIGDLKGLTEKLDYINDGIYGSGEDLECNGIWLMPIFPSPTYHKYDTTDYMGIDKEYGTMEDFETFLAEAHKRGISVILDLAVNHTSNEHPWFQEAETYLKGLSEGEEPDSSVCPYVDYYNFSREKGNGYEPLRGTDWFYEARFWSGMPDLNLDSEAVRKEITQICRFWLEKEVDGFRLDAVTSYYTEDEKASIDFLAFLEDTVTGIKPDAYMVGEAWLGQNGYSAYYASGLDSFFDFKFAGAEGTIATVVNKGKKATTYTKAMEEEEILYGSLNPNFVNAPFYTNHDMARGAGYFAKGSKVKCKMAGALNLLMTGNAFIYYGEEIGMKGSGKDENKRAPMLWNSEETEAGTCKGPKDMDRFDMPYEGVSQQLADGDSILQFYREAIRIRNAFPVIARGYTTALDLAAVTDAEGADQKETGSAAAFLRQGEEGDLLVLLNVSENPLTVTLPEEAASYEHLAARLLAAKGEITEEDGRITLPGYSVGIFTRE
ncbi:MAG: alpha-amylase [Lachnospiraceae bacterium]|nr:alpha-amylase [Lachnospiraceae bacterium]